jgi:hypothetical protein
MPLTFIGKISIMQKNSLLLCVVCLLLLSPLTIYCQEQARRSNFHIGLDIQTKYIWRGMEMMTENSTPVLFPQLNYQSNGLVCYVMGGYSINGKYCEVDLGISYSYQWLSIGINDYYYPTINSAKDGYFNLNNHDTGHWFEGVITISPGHIPISFTISNFFAGADKKENGDQAYSTYAEITGYYDFIDSHRAAITIGTAFNNSCYNGYAHDFCFCNIELKYTYKLSFHNFVLPLSAAYIINPVYEKSHVNLTTSFAF